MLASRACLPKASLSLPVVLATNALRPTAVFLTPVVLAVKALKPTAVFASPVVFAVRASLPIATFSLPPEAIDAAAPSPKCTLSVPSVAVRIEPLLSIRSLSVGALLSDPSLVLKIKELNQPLTPKTRSKIQPWTYVLKVDFRVLS